MATFNYECDGQMSIFDILPTEKPDKYKIIKEILIDVIKNGTGFVDGKKRVYELYQSDMTSDERANRIKDEYGVGGRSLHGEYFRHGFQNHDAKGIEIEFDNVKYLFSWEKVEKTIHSLIDSGKYYRPKVIGYCHATNNPCNRENLTPVARELGMKCTAPCCAGCPERKECGAACNYSHNY